MKDHSLRKVMIIGSGPIVIGQAAEFDYAGTQACKAVREEGITTVLVNSNPATIMTDEDVADVVYIEPLTVEVVERIIRRERPDGLLATLGGQTGLNLAREVQEAGILKDTTSGCWELRSRRSGRRRTGTFSGGSCCGSMNRFPVQTSPTPLKKGARSPIAWGFR